VGRPPEPAAEPLVADVRPVEDDGQGDASIPLVGRRGRPAEPPANTDIARELRRRRELLRLSIREAAERTGVSHTVISEIERGKRLPTVRTFERLRHGLGLDASPDILVRPPQPVDSLEVHLSRLGACLWASGSRIHLADLAASLGTSAAVVREQLPLVAPRFGTLGLAVVTDGAEVRIEPLLLAESALSAMGKLTHQRRLSALSTDAMALLAYIGWHEEASRSDLEDLRGEDCTVLLGRLVNVGLLDVVRARDGNRANRYRLTTDALQAMGVASPEELRATLTPLLGDVGAAKCADASFARTAH
jgi:transcriptional regulator with XRE-family HTH domain